MGPLRHYHRNGYIYGLKPLIHNLVFNVSPLKTIIHSTYGKKRLTAAQGCRKEIDKYRGKLNLVKIIAVISNYNVDS